MLSNHYWSINQFGIEELGTLEYFMGILGLTKKMTSKSLMGFQAQKRIQEHEIFGSKFTGQFVNETIMERLVVASDHSIINIE